MKLINYLLLVLIFGCTQVQTEPIDSEIEHNYPIDKYTIFINKIDSAQNAIKLEEDSISQEYYCELNFDQYFKIYDHLKIKPDWSAESHYRHFGDAGRSLVVFFQKDNHYSDSIKWMLDKNITYKGNGDEHYEISESIFNYIDTIDLTKALEIQQNELGYFQYCVFYLIGDNYCNFGHSNYGEKSIITSQTQLDQILSKDQSMYYQFNKKEKKTIRNIDFQVNVNIKDNKAIVKLITLTPWEGFQRETYEISTQFPHKFKQVSTEILLDYNCGILF